MANLVSHSSSVGQCWIHLAFKVKYAHKIFDIPEIKARMNQLLWEAINKYNLRCKELGIDRDHVHFVLDIGLYTISQVVKWLKGYTAKNLLQEHPWLKQIFLEFWALESSIFLRQLGQGHRGNGWICQEPRTKT